MAPKTQVFRWTFSIPVERDKLWDFVTDTERVNRLAGVFKVDYSYRPLESGGSEVHARARVSGMELRWIERPAEWVRPARLSFVREYYRGPFQRMVVEHDLRDGEQSGSTVIETAISMTPRNRIGALLAPVAIGVKARKGFERAYALAPEWAAGRELPAIGVEKPRIADFQRDKLERLARAGADITGDPDLAERIIRLLATQPDSEIAELRPYALADAWGKDRRATLRYFLHATKSGLFDTHWRVLCPGCRRSKDSFTSLAELHTRGHCDSCNIDFGVDFDRSVELVFSPEPVGLGTQPAQYCHFSPSNTPHVVSSWRFEPGETRALDLALAAGKHQFVSPQVKSASFFDVQAVDAFATPALRLTADGILGVPERIPAGSARMEASNALPVPAVLSVTRTAWADTAVSAADVTAMQEFRDLFSAQVLGPGAEFSIRNMVFLFSDLVGSTSMYATIGDGVAFSLVRRHFDLLRDIYTRHEGALVKTIGDAVMAVFRDGARAFRAAVEMHERIGVVRDEATGVVLALRIGLSGGPCIAMEANGRVDYFGTTVNTAARVEAQAGRGEIAMSGDVLDAPGTREALAEKSLAAETVEARLKGLDGAFRIYKVGVGA